MLFSVYFFSLLAATLVDAGHCRRQHWGYQHGQDQVPALPAPLSSEPAPPPPPPPPPPLPPTSAEMPPTSAKMPSPSSDEQPPPNEPSASAIGDVKALNASKSGGRTRPGKKYAAAVQQPSGGFPNPSGGAGGGGQQQNSTRMRPSSTPQQPPPQQSPQLQPSPTQPQQTQPGPTMTSPRSAQPTNAANATALQTGGGAGGALMDQHTGDLTFYVPKGGKCETNKDNAGNVCAISAAIFDFKFCGKTAVITNNKTGQKLEVGIVDQCIGCKPSDLDVNLAAFEALGFAVGVGRATGLIDFQIIDKPFF